MITYQHSFAIGGLLLVGAIVVLALTGHCVAQVGPFAIH